MIFYVISYVHSRALLHKTSPAESSCAARPFPSLARCLAPLLLLGYVPLLLLPRRRFQKKSIMAIKHLFSVFFRVFWLRAKEFQVFS